MLEATPTFSVVIPSYNRAALVVRAVRSALAQSIPPAEILVVDDGSTDNTEARLRELGPGLRYFRQNRGGPARARNRGVELATSRWVAFLDSDDMWDPMYLEAMAKAIVATDGRAAVYFADAEVAGSDSSLTLWEQADFSIAGVHALFAEAHELVLREIQPMLLQFSVFDRERYLELGGLHEELMTAEDTHLFLRCGLRYMMCAVAVKAGTLTCDDAPENRLTGVFDRRAVGRWKNSVLMYRDILHHDPQLARKIRRLLRKRLAESYWRLARLEWGAGQVRAPAGAAVQALVAHPGIAFTILRRSAWKLPRAARERSARSGRSVEG